MSCYASLSKKQETVLLDPIHKHGELSPLGSNLFEFLSLDLTEYNKAMNYIYNLTLYLHPSCGYESVIEVYNSLSELYPKTAKFLNEDFPGRFSPGNFNIHSARNDIGDFLVFNKDINPNIYSHPYIEYSDVFFNGFTNMDFPTELDNSLDLLKYQSLYNDLMTNCFIENPYGTDLSPLQKFQLYLILNAGSVELYEITNGINYVPYIPLEVINARTEYRRKKEKTKEIDYLKEIVKKHNVLLVAECYTPKDFLFFEFYQLLKKEVKIKKCMHCGKYFILKGDYATDYCDRIPMGETQTCRRLAATNTYKNKIKTNPILTEYQKAYKRNYAKVSSKRWSSEQFRVWTEESVIKRDEFVHEYSNLPTEEIVKRFKEYLGNR